MGFFRKQLLDIIEWVDIREDLLVYMFPMEDQEIQNGAKLTVRPGQVAIFVDKGQIADVFGPGMYQLKTDNLPLLSNLKSWGYGFKSPFKSDVYFINMKEFLGNKWGTTSPIWIPDKQFGQVQIRAYGEYCFHITNPVHLLSQIVGAKFKFQLEDLEDKLRVIILSEFSDIIGSLKLTVTQIASNYSEIGEALKETLKTPFNEMGLDITRLTIANIGLPEEIEEQLKQLTGMNILGSIENETLNKVQMLKQLEIMGKAAEHGHMSTGMQAGIELGMGMQMAETMVQGIKQSSRPTQSLQVQEQCHKTCPQCKAIIKEGAKFCSECGSKIQVETLLARFCTECGEELEPGMKFCSKCGHKV